MNSSELPSGTPPRAAPAPTKPKTRILFVDDSEDNVELFTFLLAREDTEVRAAYNGIDGLAVFKEFKPQICILDLGMPGLDGFALAQAIRSASTEDLLLVAVTGHALKRDVHRALASGFDYHFAKPANVRALIDLVNGVRGAEPPP